MWVTQTYLKSPEPNAKLHVYYLFQNYSPKEVQRTKEIARELERMGDRFGGNVALLMPSPQSADRIEGEVREMRPLWDAVVDQLPGVLICTRPMSETKFEDGEHYFVSLSGKKTAEEAAETLQRVFSMVSEQLDYVQRQAVVKAGVPKGRFARFFEAVELKPGVAGVRIDLKKLLRIG